MTPALLLLADGRFPAGGHAYSAGVESAVRVGDVSDPATLERYLDGRLALGATDASFAAATAAALREGRDVAVLDHEYGARVMSPRLRSISRRLGRQLARSASAVWPHAALGAVGCIVGGPHQPIALGAATVAAGGTPADAVTISYHHLATAVTTAAVRLLGLDPLTAAGLQARAISRLGLVADDAEVWATAEPRELPAIGGTLTEILGEVHGTLDARLFVA